MPLYSMPENEMRNHCKRAIEGLEFWLRRLIDNRLSDAYGPNYVDATRADGSRIIRSELSRKLVERLKAEPQRFSRDIDAALLDEQIDIICNPVLYKDHFRVALESLFPQGNEVARTTLQRLIAPRNALYHSNPLSVHAAYRVLCYSMDVVEALKDYYARISMAEQYNVPTVIKVSDSLGRVEHLSGSNRHPNGPAMIDYSNDASAYLRCGDTISIEVEVDPAFDAEDYDIEWLISNIGGPKTVGPKFSLVLIDRYVSTRFCVVCRVTSKKAWHKLGTFDDQIDIAYRVLPPP